jgi:hypothetical protein
MNQGFYLTLMMGSFIASPVPQAVIDALSEVQVTSTVGSQGGFQLKFTMARNSPLTMLHESGFFNPRQRVVIAVTVNGSTEVLMDGIVTKQDVTPSSQAGKSAFTITGVDLTALMDFIDFTGIPYISVPTFVMVEMCLAKYLPLGVVPIAIPTFPLYIALPTDKYFKQQGTDYEFVTTLANAAKAPVLGGWTFYLDPGPKPGMSIAYWGPDISKLFPAMQPALSINFDATTNLDSINFSYDGTLATNYIAMVIEPNTKVPIPIPLPSIDFIKAPYAAHAPTPLKYKQFYPGAGKGIVEGLVDVVAKLMETADVISGSGQLDVLRYGHIFKARQLAAVRGAGNYYDGKYYVKSVTHNIKRGEYKQSFTLSRGGTGSSVSTVDI